MSDLPAIGLAEALDAAKDTRAYRAGIAFDVPADGLEQYTAEVIRAAAPIIERQARESIAVEIETAVEHRLDALCANRDAVIGMAVLSGLGRACARIARGGA